MAAQVLLRESLWTGYGSCHINLLGPHPGTGKYVSMAKFWGFNAVKQFGAHQWHKVNEETCSEHEECLQEFCKCDLENSYLIDANI